MKETVAPMQENAAHPRPRFDRLWWLGVAIIVLIGGWLRFTGYTVSLPYFEHVDEPWLFYEAAYQRGLIEDLTRPNPSPGLIAIFHISQIVTERLTGESSLDHMSRIFAVLRFVGSFVSLGTLVLLALAGRQIAGRVAGWLAALVWAIIPLVVYHSFIAISEPYMMLFAALAFYAAARAVHLGETQRQDAQRWAIISVWAGLLGFSFKYSMFPFPGLGIAVVLWYIFRDTAHRRLWLRTLGVQAASIISFLVVLFTLAGLGDTFTRPEREIGTFFENPLARLLDVPLVINTYSAAFPQFGTTALVYWGVVLIAFGVLLKTRQYSAQLGFWVLLALFANGLAVMVALYVVISSTLNRYLFAANMTFILLGAAALAVLYEYVSARLRGAWRTAWTVASIALVVVWLSPVATQAIAEAHGRTLPQTTAEMMLWASASLGEGDILAETIGSRAFSREWGNYQGTLRQIREEPDVLSRSSDEWIDEGYRFLQIAQVDVDRLMATPEGAAFVGRMLELRSFPPPEATGAWNGVPYVVYQLRQPERVLDVTFGDLLRLTGCDCDKSVMTSGETLSITLYWQPIMQPTRSYSAFVHLYPLDEIALLAQADGAPGPLRRPTISWDLPSETLISDLFMLTLPDLAAGEYRLVLGVYDQETGERLRVGESDFYVLSTLTVR